MRWQEGKKAAQGLTPEKKLAQALVPMEEQPYQIPENWCWVRLENISKRISDGSHNPPKDAGNGIPILSATNIHDHFIDIDAATRWVTENQWKAENERTQIEPNDVLVTIVATIGRTAVVKEEIFALQRSVAVIKPKINSEFLSYFIETPYVQVYMNSNAKGTAQKGFYLSSLEQLYCVLPPLAEQQRIVDRIESIFAKLDEAKEKAQAVVDGFELRKSAILHKAFTGELTRAWRKENGQDESNWKRVRFDEVAEIKSNLVDPAEYQEYPHIAPDNIEKKTGVLLEYHTIAEDGVKSGKHRFYAGQILYSKIRPYLSKVVIATVDGLCSADMYPIDAKGNVKFLWYYMLSDEFLAQASNSGSRSVLPKINQKELSRVMVKTTSIEEQQAIADILDSLIAKENAAKEAAESVLDQIDTMKKAVLASAFRGELGTNDPTEASAVELLKSML